MLNFLTAILRIKKTNNTKKTLNRASIAEDS